MGLNETTLHISFANQQVAVTSSVEAILAPVQHMFRRLLTNDPSEVLDKLTVEGEQGTYQVGGASAFGGGDGSLRGTLQSIKFEVIHRFVEANPDLLWLHAGAAATRIGSDMKAIVLCGAWGRGKSTLVANLCRKDWLYLSDDIVPVAMASGKLVSFPLTPMMREHDEADRESVLNPVQVSGLKKTVVDLADDAFLDQPVSIAGIVFPQYDPHAQMMLEPASPASATLELMQNCLNLKYHKDAAVRYLAGLVGTVPVYKLPYNNGAQAADLLIDAHAPRSAVS